MIDDSVQNKAYAQAEMAEKKAFETVDSVENSKLGKNLPVDISEIHITDIIKLLMTTLIFNFIPLYLMFGSPNVRWDFPRRYLNFAFIISYIVSFTLILTIYLTGARDLYKFVIFAKVVKLGLATILMIFFTLKDSYISMLIGVLYLAYLVFLDFTFMYYLGIYLKRLDSNMYDDYGVPVQNKVQEKV